MRKKKKVNVISVMWCFVAAWNLRKWDWLKYYLFVFHCCSLSPLSLPLNPVCPSLAKACSHYPVPSIFFPLNSPSLCSSEIRCSSLWAVVRCERRGAFPFSLFSHLHDCKPGRTTTHMYPCACWCRFFDFFFSVCVLPYQCACTACFPGLLFNEL